MNLKRFQVLGYLQIFIGMGALSGGLPMILTPNGGSSGLNTDILQNTPFTNFLIPGILLFTINGIGSLVGAYFSLKFKKQTGFFGIFLGIALIIWIITQMYLLGFVSWLQPLFGTLGVLELVLGIIIYRKQQ